MRRIITVCTFRTQNKENPQFLARITQGNKYLTLRIGVFNERKGKFECERKIRVFCDSQAFILARKYIINTLKIPFIQRGYADEFKDGDHIRTYEQYFSAEGELENTFLYPWYSFKKYNSFATPVDSIFPSFNKINYIGVQ